MNYEKHILFSTDMVKAILEGRKTQTRRVVKLPMYHPDVEGKKSFDIKGMEVFDENGCLEGMLKCPYGKPGDLLWVRETWAMFLDGFLRKSTNEIFKGVKWKPSIHMKKVYAQIWLEITDIRVERLNDISEEDAEAEGVLVYEDGTYRNYFKKKGLREQDGVECLLAKGSFQSLWDSINDKPAKNWTANPWVWVISFKVLSTTGKPNQESGAGDDYPVIEAYHKVKEAVHAN